MPKVSRMQNDLDRKTVIDLLLKDPFITADAIAARGELSIQQVYRILHILEEEGIIAGNPVSLDLTKLGLKRYIVMAKRGNEMPSEKSIRSAAYSDEFLSGMACQKINIIPEDDYTCTGEFDIVWVFLAENMVEATKYVDYLRMVSKGHFRSFSIQEVLFTTRRNMTTTPDMDRYKDYVEDLITIRRTPIFEDED